LESERSVRRVLVSCYDYTYLFVSFDILSQYIYLTAHLHTHSLLRRTLLTICSYTISHPPQSNSIIPFTIDFVYSLFSFIPRICPQAILDPIGDKGYVVFPVSLIEN
jgi:hypothetical protein